MFPRILLSHLGLIASLLPATGDDGWLTDFEAAKARAADRQKDLLLNFTGSGWCPPCIRLKAEVFDQDGFKEWVADKFVLVELDFPRDPSKLDGETAKQNERLAEQYAIEGYPTVVLADAQGRPYAASGYQPGGAEAYVDQLEALRDERVARDRFFSEAAKLEGVEKAKALLNGLGNLADATIDRFYPEVVRQIEAADPQDESGFREGRDYRQAVRDYDKQIEALFVIKQYGRAIQSVDAFLAEHEPTGRDKQHILLPKVMANVELGRKEEAFAAIEEIREAAPESELSGQLDDIKVRIEQYTRDNKAAPAEEPPPVPGPECK